MDGYVWEGKLYGMPNEYNLEIGAVLANKRMFEEAGLTYPPTWGTWEDLVADAKKMTKVENDVMTVAGFNYVTGDGLGFLFWEGILEKGAEYFANDGCTWISSPRRPKKPCSGCRTWPTWIRSSIR